LRKITNLRRRTKLIIKIDLKNDVVVVETEAGVSSYALASPEAFSVISQAWLRCGWDNKYVYGFSWMGRPIIQLPEDMFRLQEVIYRLKPDVIIETGIAHGGSLIFYASLCKAMERGRVVGVDIEIRPHNRQAIESHELSPPIRLIEGSPIDSAIVERVGLEVQPGERVLVLLDSCHTKEHVLAELNAYAPLVSEGSYIVAMDGIMEQVSGAPRTQPDWSWNNPLRAAVEFVEQNPDFVIEEPPFVFNEGNVSERVTYWPSGFIKRIK
jgi:cephalosporin hydroxylase